MRAFNTWGVLVAFVPAFAVAACGSSSDGNGTSGRASTGGSSGSAPAGTSGAPGSSTGVGVSLSGTSNSVPLMGSPDGGAYQTTSGDGAAASSLGTVLTMTIRDFKMYNPNDPMTNPDFEDEMGDDRGIVQKTLGSDGTPVYAPTNTPDPTTGLVTNTTHGAKWFAMWYHDTPGWNLNVPYPIQLTQSGNTFGYDSLVSGVQGPQDATPGFFPIDDGTMYQTAFGNQDKPHNYSFTTEIHTEFTYHGGETFKFSGDDDVFVFINKQLVIDLGGVHVRQESTVVLDSLGLTPGQTYPLDFFGAERHTVQSNVAITTTLVLRPATNIPR